MIVLRTDISHLNCECRRILRGVRQHSSLEYLDEHGFTLTAHEEICPERLGDRIADARQPHFIAIAGEGNGNIVLCEGVKCANGSGGVITSWHEGNPDCG